MSCLFNSLSHFLPASSGEIRAAACAYLSSHQPLIDGLQTGDVCDAQYIRNMQQQSTWGSAIEIRAVCSVYKVRVSVHSTRREDKGAVIVFEPYTGQPSLHRTIDIDWNGSHYTPMSRRRL